MLTIQTALKARALIFDLDGTLIDSAQSIKSSISVSFERAGVIPTIPLDKIQIGPPLIEIMTSLVGKESRRLLPDLLQNFIWHYDQIGYRSTRIYDGVSDMLKKFREDGWALYIATNKRIVPTRKIINILKWDRLFDGVYSLDSFSPNLVKKTDLIGHIIDECDLSCSTTVYVGDSREDEKAAFENRIKFILVEWGYGSLEPEGTGCVTVGNTQELESSLKLYS